MIRVLLIGLLFLVGGCSTMNQPNDTALAADVSAAGVRVRAPNWQPGSEWHYNDGYGLKVIQAGGDVTTFQRIDDPAQWITRRDFLREDAQSSTVLRKVLFEGLPPGAGAVLSGDAPITYRREYMAGNVQRTHVTSWTVEGRATVKVPAGEFDCVILTMRTRNTDDGWTGFERWWYSAKAQNFVRMEYRYGSNPAGSRVLTDYRLSPTSFSLTTPARPPGLE